MGVSNELNDLKKLLEIYDVEWKHIFTEEDVVVKYSYSTKKSGDVVSLFEFRNSRNSDHAKMEKINSIVQSLRLSNEEFIIIHHLIMTKNRDAFIYTNLACDKMLGILTTGLENKNQEQ